MSHSFAGCASTARSTFPTSVRRTISQCWCSIGDWRTFLSRSTSSAGGIHWNPERTSHRGASLHPGADQAAGNLRRPSGDRHRERAAVPRTQGVTWSSKLRPVKSWASSPARRRISSRCWMSLPKAPHGCAKLASRQSGVATAPTFGLSRRKVRFLSLCPKEGDR